MKYNTLLLVEDEPQIRRVLQTTLAQAGYGVILAKDGQEGFDTVAREHPDLVLLDINLPDMSGFEVCRMIRVSFAGPILMVTVRNLAAHAPQNWQLRRPKSPHTFRIYS